jgi:hypothetical protein
MKTLAIAAGALLLGTSALALTTDKTVEGKPMADQSMASLSADKQLKKADMDVLSDAGVTTAADYDAQYAALEPEGAKRELVSYDSWQDEKSVDATVPADTMAYDQTMPADSTVPVETAALDLTPRPAAANYPACHPGPGDDNCIQLYERGVRAELASWDRPTGGFLGADSTAMASADSGLPPEPMSTDTTLASNDVAYDADSTAVMANGEPADSALAASDTALASNDATAGYPVSTESAYQGMGGPEEMTDAEVAPMQTGYPPCSRAITDRCIQLYEPGVTGAGN